VDTQRATLIITGAEGKRLTYRRTDSVFAWVPRLGRARAGRLVRIGL